MFKLGKKSILISSPTDGMVMSLSKVGDPVFSQGILGPGVAVKPDSGYMKAPCKATIEQMFETGHAASLLTDSGVQLLIHVGIGTVNLKGRHYRIVKNSGEKVDKGDILVEFDREAINAEGFDTVTPIIICNPDDFESISFAKDGPIKVGEALITINY